MKSIPSYPKVSLKMAQSLDGKIATYTGSSKWITSEKARKHVQKLRAQHDAILVGKNTALIDNPSLNVRLRSLKNKKQPIRIVLDPRMQLKDNAKVFQNTETSKTFRVVFEKELLKKRKQSSKSYAFIPVKEKNGRVDLKQLLKILKEIGVEKLLVEGGAELIWSFISEELAQKIYWFIAPKFIGGSSALTSVEGKGVRDVNHAYPIKKMKINKIGNDILVKGDL